MGLTVLKTRVHSKNLPKKTQTVGTREREGCESSHHRPGTNVSSEKRHKSAKNTLSQVIFFNEHGFFMRCTSSARDEEEEDEEKKNLWFLHVHDKPDDDNDSSSDEYIMVG